MKEIELKQHTPIIHFQHDEPGATLRASELKPKIDKFIAHELENVDPVLFNKYKTIIREKSFFPMAEGRLEKGCNKYSIVIVQPGAPTIERPLPSANQSARNADPLIMAPTSYFAKKHRSIYSSEKIKVKIKAFFDELAELVAAVLPYVCVYENYGARATKGFGCYYPQEMTVAVFEEIAKKKYVKVYKLIRKAQDYAGALKNIHENYQLLKSGRRTPYSKPLLFEYMCSKNIGWEKKEVKRNMPEVIHGTRPPIQCSRDPREYRYIRAMLGLAEINEYRPETGVKQIKIESKDLHPDGRKKYQRLASPITFKVFDNAVYLLPNTTYKQILDKTFVFSLETQSGTKSFEIDTPAAFDLIDFLDFVVSRTNSPITAVS